MIKGVQESDGMSLRTMKILHRMREKEGEKRKRGEEKKSCVGERGNFIHNGREFYRTRERKEEGISSSPLCAHTWAGERRKRGEESEMVRAWKRRGRTRHRIFHLHLSLCKEASCDEREREGREGEIERG